MSPRDFLIQHKIKTAERARLSGNAAPTQDIQGSGPPNRHGMPKLPPKQREVKNWPVLDLGIHPDIPTANWKLDILGEVGNPMTLDWDAFMALPQTEDTSDFHCVTTWSRMDNRWTGVRFRDLAEHVQLKPSASHVYFTAYDDYSTNLKLEEALDEDVLLVHAWEGQPLPREHGGPARIVVPRKYAWKGAKWIRQIHFLDHEEKGFWENRGYSNEAEPWYNDRYALKPGKLPG